MRETRYYKDIDTVAATALLPEDTDSSARYRQEVLSTYLNLVHAGVDTYEALARIKGAFPSKVAEIVNIPPYIHPDSDRGVDASPHDITLYEWHFDNATAQSIASMASNLGARVACFGTPTVAVSLAKSGVDVRLFDLSPHLHARGDLAAAPQLDVTRVDLSRFELPEDRLFDCVVLDPPWYLEHMLAWVENARRVLIPGGTIIIAVPQDLTKRSALVERLSLLAELERIGCVEILVESLRYVTPSFEFAALSQFGLTANWRRGDTFVVRNCDISITGTFMPVSDETWQRFMVNDIAVAVTAVDDTGDIDVFEVVSYTSHLAVSRSDRVASNSNVLTSSGASAVVTGTALLVAALSSLSIGASIDEALSNVPESQRDGVGEFLQSIGAQKREMLDA